LQVGKAATNYTKVLQETVVAKAPLLADFNKEQEEFIKSKVSISENLQLTMYRYV
jgi:hypothetical protein